MALELSSMILNSGESGGQVVADAKAIKVAALKALASQQTSVNGRNYYSTQVNIVS